MDRQRTPIRLIVGTSLLVFSILFLAIVGLAVGSIYSEEPKQRELWVQLSPYVLAAGVQVWSVAKPLLQLALLLLIVDWLLGRLGVTPLSAMAIGRGGPNVQAILALIVVGALGIAALTDVQQGLHILKDLSLVVVGFYFGTQRKIIALETADGKLTAIEEHENPQPTPPRTDQTGSPAT